MGQGYDLKKVTSKPPSFRRERIWFGLKRPVAVKAWSFPFNSSIKKIIQAKDLLLKKSDLFLSPIWSDKSRKSKAPLRRSPPIECQSLCWWNALHAKWAPDPLDSRSPAKSRFSRWNCKEGATNLWLTNFVLHVLGDQKEEEKCSKKKHAHTSTSTVAIPKTGVVWFPSIGHCNGTPCHIPTWHLRRSTNSPTFQHGQRLVQQRLGGSRIASWAHEILGLEHHFCMHQMPISPLNLVFVVY